MDLRYNVRLLNYKGMEINSLVWGTGDEPWIGTHGEACAKAIEMADRNPGGAYVAVAIPVPWHALVMSED